MTKEEIDIMWQKAMQESIKYGELFTRYHFAKLVAERALADSMQEVQRLGQEIEQEPVGMVQDLFTYTAWEKLDVRGSTKVYLDIPPQRTWVGLTEEDRAKILSRKWWDFEDEFDVDGFLRLAEAKLKKKNT
jgi:hypothetical protein